MPAERDHADPAGTDGVRAAYDAVARGYADAIGGELAGKPLDRALLAAVAELAAGGRLADVGCGPGHVTAFLAGRHPDVLGIDLSPAMVAVARERHPGPAYEAGSMLADRAGARWAGAVAMYSVIHLSDADRRLAFRRLRAALRPGGWLLVAFHVDEDGTPAGGRRRVTDWFGAAVDLEFRFLDPAAVAAELAAAGLTVESVTTRRPAGGEHPSNRAYVLARRAG